MSVYSVDKLMSETRRLAAEYFRTTEQRLPVTNELAKYDVCRLLRCREPESVIGGVDVIDADQTPIQVKGRVISQDESARYRIGQLNREGGWAEIFLVLFDQDYEPFEIHSVKREEIENDNPARVKRGAMSVAKFKAIGQLRWTREDGCEA